LLSPESLATSLESVDGLSTGTRGVIAIPDGDWVTEIVGVGSLRSYLLRMQGEP